MVPIEDRELLAQLENDNEQHQNGAETYEQGEESVDLYGPTLGLSRAQNRSKFFQRSRDLFLSSPS